MGECLDCGKPLPRRRERGHREREYCSDRCRQRACRARNKEKHDLDRIKDKMLERIRNAVEQNVRRETWQDDLERQDKWLRLLNTELEYIGEQKELLQLEVASLKDLLADKEAEIVRLTVLLEKQATKKLR